MDTAILVFMILVVALSFFTVCVVISDMIRERKRKQAEEKNAKLVEAKLDELSAKQDALAAQQGAQPAIAASEMQGPSNGKQITVDEAVVAISLDEYEGQIRFSADPKQSHRTKYLALDKEQKSWYDEITDYAKSIEGVKYVEANDYDEYKLLKKRVIRLRIKKGVVICEFIITNSAFSRFISANKMSVKQAPTSFKLLEEGDVSAAKECIDIAVAEIREEDEEKKRLQKERRKQARLAAQAAAASATSSDQD